VRAKLAPFNGQDSEMLGFDECCKHDIFLNATFLHREQGGDANPVFGFHFF
jgi:hypothetical protein